MMIHKRKLLLLVALLINTTLEDIGECSSNGCKYCMTNGKEKWCTQCTHGTIISSVIMKKGRCVAPTKIENCMEGALDDPINQVKCGRCRNGYYVSDEGDECIQFNDLGSCVEPYLWDNIQLCGACNESYISNNYKDCSKNKDLIENCLYGDIETSKKCKKCKKGFVHTLDGKSCEKFLFEGCRARHPSNPDKCLLCDIDAGYVAVDAEIDSDNIFQICKPLSVGIWRAFALLFVFCTLTI